MESASSDFGIAQEIRESLTVRQSGNSETGRVPLGLSQGHCIHAIWLYASGN